MLYGKHGPYVPRYADAVCDFPNCRCEYMCNVAVPRRDYSAALSRWAIYGALAFLAVVAVLLAIGSVG